MGSRAAHYLFFVILTVLMTLSNPARSNPDEPANDTKAAPTEDEHTTSALKRAADRDSQLVRKVPDESGPMIKTNVVTSAPAPGMSTPETVKQAAPPKADHSAHAETSSIPAETSLRWLKNGNTRFVKKNFRKDGRDANDRARLTSGQKPHAIVLSCSDSRVPPEVVFDQALGEIFVIRVAGEALDSSVVASIEYAVEHLGPSLIVVMGHTQCGAVNAALTMKEGEAGSADLDRLIADIRPRLKTVLKETPSKSLEVESAVNADGVARELVRRSDIIRHKVESGALKIKTALYRLDSGKVSFF